MPRVRSKPRKCTIQTKQLIWGWSYELSRLLLLWVRVKFDGTGRASCLVLHTATAFGCRLFRLYDDDDDSDDDDIMLIRRIWRQAVQTAEHVIGTSLCLPVHGACGDADSVTRQSLQQRRSLILPAECSPETTRPTSPLGCARMAGRRGARLRGQSTYLTVDSSTAAHRGRPRSLVIVCFSTGYIHSGEIMIFKVAISPRCQPPIAKVHYSQGPL